MKIVENVSIAGAVKKCEKALLAEICSDVENVDFATEVFLCENVPDAVKAKDAGNVWIALIAENVRAVRCALPAKIAQIPEDV